MKVIDSKHIYIPPLLNTIFFHVNVVVLIDVVVVVGVSDVVVKNQNTAIGFPPPLRPPFIRVQQFIPLSFFGRSDSLTFA